ncbi:alpha/beta fold hydrolase [Streptomyces werraensis]|uniref:alpha/beta fold hydrolase n=1 Tax=Streptomyces werraensis TaxID=68284 RepID=UPI001CE3A086
MSSRRFQGRLAFTVVGEGRQPLLLLHGLGGDRSQPLALVDAAVRNRCHVLAPDLRAHGLTSLDERAELLTFSQMAADVEELLSDLMLTQPLIVVGISMGAGVAVQLLARRNLPMRGLVLIRPAWRWQPLPPNLFVFPKIAGLLHAYGPEKGQVLFRRSKSYAQIAAVSVAAADSLHQQFTAFRAIERAQRLTAIPASAPARPVSSDTATLVIGNEKDPLHPWCVAERVAEDFGAPLALVPPRYEASEEHAIQVARAVRCFIQGL